jgi:hypothetical protein
MHLNPDLNPPEVPQIVLNRIVTDESTSCRKLLTFTNILELRILLLVIGTRLGFLDPLGYPLKLLDQSPRSNDDFIGNQAPSLDNCALLDLDLAPNDAIYDNTISVNGRIVENIRVRDFGPGKNLAPPPNDRGCDYNVFKYLGMRTDQCICTNRTRPAIHE